MNIIRNFSSNSFVVRSIMPVQPQNRLPGLEHRISTKRTTAPCGFFVCGARLHLSMVGRAGEPKGSPGSLLTGSSNPVRLTTSQRLEPLGGDSKNNKGVQP